MSEIDKKTNVGIEERREFSIRDAALSGDLDLTIFTADVTPEPTSEAWSYTVKFGLVDSNGRIHDWYTGDITAAAADTSTAGTASVDDATPTIINGIGTVVLSGDAADWLDTEDATVTLDGSVATLGITLTQKVFTVTFTA